MLLEDSSQRALPEAQPLPSRVSDDDPLGAEEQALDPTFVEMTQLFESPSAFVEDPPIIPAIDSEPDPEPIDAMTFTLVKVLEIVPDVRPDHVTTLVHSYLDQDGELIPPALLVEQVLHQLFENPDYPRVEKKGKKRKNTEESAMSGSSQIGGERPKKKVKIDYRATQRNKEPSVAYSNLALVSAFLVASVSVL